MQGQNKHPEIETLITNLENTRLNNEITDTERTQKFCDFLNDFEKKASKEVFKFMIKRVDSLVTKWKTNNKTIIVPYECPKEIDDLIKKKKSNKEQ